MKALLAALIVFSLLILGCAGTEQIPDQKLLFKSVSIADNQDVVEIEIYADNGRTFNAILKNGEFTYERQASAISGNFIAIKPKPPGKMEVLIGRDGTLVSEVIINPSARTGYGLSNGSYYELYNIKNLYIGDINRYSSVGVDTNSVAIYEATNTITMIKLYTSPSGYRFIQNAAAQPHVSYLSKERFASGLDYVNVNLPFTTDRGSVLTSTSLE